MNTLLIHLTAMDWLHLLVYFLTLNFIRSSEIHSNCCKELNNFFLHFFILRIPFR